MAILSKGVSFAYLLLVGHTTTAAFERAEAQSHCLKVSPRESIAAVVQAAHAKGNFKPCFTLQAKLAGSETNFEVNVCKTEPAVTSKTTTSIRNGESRYVTGKDMATILVSEENDTLAFITMEEGGKVNGIVQKGNNNGVEFTQNGQGGKVSVNKIMDSSIFINHSSPTLLNFVLGCYSFFLTHAHTLHSIHVQTNRHGPALPEPLNHPLGLAAPVASRRSTPWRVLTVSSSKMITIASILNLTTLIMSIPVIPSTPIMIILISLTHQTPKRHWPFSSIPFVARTCVLGSVVVCRRQATPIGWMYTLR
jgi:hypothetical protein